METKKWNIVAIGVTTVLIACAATIPRYAILEARAARQTAGPVDAVQGIVAAFNNHRVVLIGEDHWLRQSGNFYIQLTRDPAFQRVKPDIVVEFASRHNQELLDRYIAGDDIAMSDVRRIWRDTTKVAGWESPIYANWLAAIREVNKKLPAAGRLRVLAGDPPIDWTHVHTHEDLAACGDTNVSFATVINGAVAKKHRVLIVLGDNHVFKTGDPRGGDNTTTLVEARYPASTYVATLYLGGLSAEQERVLRFPDNGTRPSLYELAGTDLGRNAVMNGIPLIHRTDAVLYLGPPNDFVRVRPNLNDIEAEYVTELDRRAMIEWGALRDRDLLYSEWWIPPSERAAH